jgi:preprotein translocase subunit SecG|tara:strand:- start:95 stop:277 length:183 start_codon:yes stop_codon:yes gene_type:complete
MVTTWQIILAIIIVGLSIVMPIFYSYQNKKNSKKEAEPLENSQIKDYVNKINEETRNKNK